MKILKSAQIREVDAFTIKNEPITSVDLMERAAMAVTRQVVNDFARGTTVKIFVGPGNNGGDGLAVARQLAGFEFLPEVYLLKISSKLSPDAEVNLDRLKKMQNIKVYEIYDPEDFPELTQSDIIVDALFGSGLSRKLEGLPARLVKHLNRSGAAIVSIDIPSGMFGEDNDSNDKDTIIKASVTYSFQMPKLSFLFPENEEYVGHWKILDIGLMQEAIDKMESVYSLLTSDDISKNILRRSKFSHKGTFGHPLLIAGSYGKMGAAVLSAKACLRTGCGLVTIHVPKVGYEILQTALPEAMISLDWSDIIFTDVPDVEEYTRVGIGPGIGMKQNTQRALFNLFERIKTPMVIDADALNILGEHKEWISKIPANSILTPHPKEFERLVGESTGNYDRIQKQLRFAEENKVIILLKGANTSIAFPDGTCCFNSTGNPGMATAGSGDVLTGVILSLLGQGYPPEEAAKIGVYLHGMAGDLAAQKMGQEALIASDLVENIGNAYLTLKIN
ncbi:MAG: NAD(P)H-hydrate dehydratase [Bacteroidales bacterium]|jgi:NAD(P)H-hydrate epimerase|nr:NAD(P)H-hydrate dehydratase [Bacteroidales bacterium]